MVKIAKYTSIGALLLIVLPLLLWASGWQWQLENNYRWLKVWYWLTQTATLTWGVLTNTLLMIWFIWCLRYRFKPASGLIIILTVMLLIGQGMKSFIKELVQKPRPYVIWLKKQHEINDIELYAMSPKTRSIIVVQKLEKHQVIPIWLQKYWLNSTNFSFPSGHTIFATSWALLTMGLLWPRRHRVSTILLMFWASGVIVSRIELGMHWPQDIVMGVAISWLVITIGCWLVQRWIAISTSLP